MHGSVSSLCSDFAELLRHSCCIVQTFIRPCPKRQGRNDHSPQPTDWLVVNGSMATRQPHGNTVAELLVLGGTYLSVGFSAVEWAWVQLVRESLLRLWPLTWVVWRRA